MNIKPNSYVFTLDGSNRMSEIEDIEMHITFQHDFNKIDILDVDFSIKLKPTADMDSFIDDLYKCDHIKIWFEDPRNFQPFRLKLDSLVIVSDGRLHFDATTEAKLIYYG